MFAAVARDFWTLRARYVLRKLDRFTNPRGIIDRKNREMKMPVIIACLAFVLALDAIPAVQAQMPLAANSSTPFVVAQATVPPTAMTEAEKSMTPQARMARRFPQPVRVADLIGLRVLDDRDSTIGIVRQVVRTAQNNIELVVSYDGWFGWGSRPVAVPIEVVGIEGRQLASIDMPRTEYAAAPTWQGTAATDLPDDAIISIALARN